MTVTVDAHVHVYEAGDWPSRWFDYVATQWANKAPSRHPEDVRGRIEAGLADPGGDRLLGQMDRHGVDISIVLGLDWGLGMDCEPSNNLGDIHDRYARLAGRTGGRVLAFAGVDPRREGAVAVLEDALDRHGLVGLKLYPPAGFYAYEDCVLPLYAACADRGVPVAVHCGETLGLLRPRFANPLYVQDVQRRHPSLTLWIAHAGAPWWWDEAVSVAAAGVDTYLELSQWQDVAFEDEERFVRNLGRALRVLGPERILFGSDHISGLRVRPEEGYARWLEWFRDLPARARRYGVSLSEDDVGAMLGGNAVRCLGVER